MLYVWYAEPPLPEVVEYIVANMKIDLDHIDNTGWSALHYATSNPFVNLQILEILATEKCAR
jgi:predicted N-acyltransferase